MPTQNSETWNIIERLPFRWGFPFNGQKESAEEKVPAWRKRNEGEKEEKESK